MLIFFRFWIRCHDIFLKLFFIPDGADDSEDDSDDDGDDADDDSDDVSGVEDWELELEVSVI